MRKDAKITTARRFRKPLTHAELWLWLRLRERSQDGPIFRCQRPVGPYILDFYCVKAHLCIEVDGAQHSTENNRRYDQVRDQWLAEQGIHTYRIPAADVLADPDGVTDGIVRLATDRPQDPIITPTA